MAFGTGAAYLFYKMPYWVLGALGLSEILESCSMDRIYLAEGLILFALSLIVIYIIVTYKANLAQLELKQLRDERSKTSDETEKECS